MPNVERIVSVRTAGSHALGRGSQPTAWPSAKTTTGTLPSSTTSTIQRMAPAVRQCARTRKNASAVSPIVRNPTPRPNVPSTLWAGANDVTVATADQPTPASTSQTIKRSLEPTGVPRQGPVPATPVSAMMIHSAQTFGSS